MTDVRTFGHTMARELTPSEIDSIAGAGTITGPFYPNPGYIPPTYIQGDAFEDGNGELPWVGSD